MLCYVDTPAQETAWLQARRSERRETQDFILDIISNCVWAVELRIYVATPTPCLNRPLITMLYLSVEVSESLIVWLRGVSLRTRVSKDWFVICSLTSFFGLLAIFTVLMQFWNPGFSQQFDEWPGTDERRSFSHAKLGWLALCELCLLNSLPYQIC